MKKIYELVTFLIIGMGLTNAQSNLGLEEWTDNDPDDWSTLNIAMQLSLPQTTFQEDTDPVEGNYYARILSTEYAGCLACPIVNLPTDGDLPGLLSQSFEVVNQIPISFSFSVKYESGAGGDNGVVMARAFNWDPVEEERVFVAGAILTLEQDVLTWEQHTVDFDVLTVPDSIEILVSASIGGLGVPGAPPLESGSQIWVDDFSFVFDDVTCPNPHTFDLSEVTTEQAIIEWLAGDEEEEWEVIWGLEDFDPTDAAQIIGNELVEIEPEIEITNLESGTTYDVYVRAVCGVDDESFWEKITFTTLSTCPIIINEEVLDVTFESASISWSVGGDEEEWEVLWGLGDFDPTDEMQHLGLDTTDATSFDFVDLTPETTYDVYVRALCTETDQSDWVKISFSTPESCPSPNDVTVSDITIDGALVSWSAGGDETSWEVIWGENGFDPAVTAEQIGNEEATVTSITISELDDDTTYDVYVRAVCSIDDESDWEKVTFTTEIDDASVFTNEEQVIALYPNPAKDYFKVSLSSQDDFTLTMIDAQGRVVKTQSKVVNGTTITTYGLTEGFYFVKLSNGMTTFSGKVVLK